MPTNGVYKTLFDAISLLLTDLVTDGTLGELLVEPDADFEKYPAAVVYPKAQGSDYQSTAQNIRTYSFVVGIYYSTTGALSVGDALIALFDTADSVIDKLDQNSLLLGTSMPSGKDIVNIEPTTSEPTQDEARQLLGMDVVVNIRVTADF